MLTGAADQSAKLWDCETGRVISSYDTPSSVRVCGFCSYGSLIMFSTEDRKDVGCEIFLYDLRASEPTNRFPVEGQKVTAGLWGPFDEYLITGHEDGSVCHYDYKVSGCGCGKSLLLYCLAMNSCELFQVCCRYSVPLCCTGLSTVVGCIL